MRTAELIVLTCLAALAPAADSLAADSDVGAEFAAICAERRSGTGEYYGEGAARALETELEAPPADIVEAVRLRGVLAVRYLELGRTRRSLELLEEILATALEKEFDPHQVAVILWNLGLAHLQEAETINCVDSHSAASCIFPFTAEARHRQPAAARRAADALEALLEIEPQRVDAAWLLNLSRMLSGEFPHGVPERFRMPGAVSGTTERSTWRDVAPRLGINAFDLAGGAVMDDFDGDGLLDIVTSTWDPCGSIKAFRNDGVGGFEDVASRWGLDEQLGGLNLVHADFDGDGRLDLLVLRGAWLHSRGRIRNSLLHNRIDGKTGRFVDVTRRAGLAEPAYPTQAAAWADYDLDGDLDLYVANELAAPGEPYPSQLFRNAGDGTFEDVAVEAGVVNLRPAKGVAWGDYDDDGDPDLYVSNLGVNRLYRNRGDGTFEDLAAELGVTAPEGRSFATWFFDFDNDGDLDLFVADYGSAAETVHASYFGVPAPRGQPLLYRNDGGRFTEVSRRLGLSRPVLPMGANYGDIDNDGWLDVYLGTGEPNYSSIMPNVMLRNEAAVRFSEVTTPGGFGHLQKGHGVAFGDVDNDGDQDLLHQLGGFFPGDAYFNALFENPGSDAHWITLRLVGRRANRFALGGRVEVRFVADGRVREVHRLVGSGGSFGGSSFQQEIGLGAADEIVELVVEWPGGDRQAFPDVALDTVYRIEEGEEELRALAVDRLRLAPGSDD